MKNLLTLFDLKRDEILKIINLSKIFKEMGKRGIRYINVLGGKNIALIFQKPSTRTVASLSIAIKELGGFSYIFFQQQLQLRRGETFLDMVKVYERYFDALIARVFSHKLLEQAAAISKIPIINALSNSFHPLQAISDIFTIYEYFKKFNGLTIAFIGDGTSNVLNSLIVASAKLGINLIIASPPQYSPSKVLLNRVKKLKDETNAIIKVVSDPKEAVKEADVIYTDVFVSMGFESESEKRKKIFMPKYQVNLALLKHIVKKKYVFMHCLPAHRNEEVTNEVIDDPKHSIVWTQAENRIYTAKATLAYLLKETDSFV